jgi:peptidoglycan-associated lipoprotein
MKIKITLLLTFSFILTIVVQAQYVLNEADAQYELYNYRKAIDLYEQAYKKKISLHAAERLGECYKGMGNYKEAESWFAIASAMPNAKADNTLHYAEALQSNSKYQEAKIQYNKYADQNTNLTAGQKSIWLLSCDSALKWMKEPSRAVVKNQAKLNTTQNEWGLTKSGNQLVFASDRFIASENKTDHKKSFLKFDGAKLPDKNIDGATGNAYFRLYLQNLDYSIQLFSFQSGTEYHVGPASFTADGKQMYFAVTKIHNDLNYVKAKALKGKLATVNVEIYAITKDASGNWSTPVPFKYNNVNEYSLSDPYITADGNSLYFASNMPDGMGGSDLYVVQKTDAGEWGRPVNLKEVNTAGDERSPFFDDQNNFYFSSNGRIGMGGFDIYKANLSGGKISEPKNMGYPINSAQDDFSFILIDKGIGYLSSNRIEGLGGDDIYQFNLQEVQKFNIGSVVLDKKTGLPISNALVTLKQSNGNTLKTYTDDKGTFTFSLDQQTPYDLKIEKTNFRNNTLSFSTFQKPDKAFFLEEIELNKEIRLENIYYDFDQSSIRPDAAIELDKLIQILQDNPTLWIELGSYTDSRGNESYNKKLSQRRADVAVQYLIEKGINKNRIEAKGYGESRLLNACANGVTCSEAEHQQNRRTEFTIVKK